MKDFKKFKPNKKKSLFILDKFKDIFAPLLDNPKYLEKVKKHFHLDYRLIWSVRFYKSQQLTGIHTG